MSAEIQVGSRVYLANAVAGEPGTVTKIVRARAEIYWSDLNMTTHHSVDTLILDESFTSLIPSLDLDGVAA